MRTDSFVTSKNNVERAVKRIPSVPSLSTLPKWSTRTNTAISLSGNEVSYGGITEESNAKCNHNKNNNNNIERRQVLRNTMALILASSSFSSSASNAYYILDEDSGEYVQVEDVKWQNEWKGRLDKMQTMSKEEIFEAGRGAGNVNLKDMENESLASKKRRAMSACRDANARSKAQVKNEKECTARVFSGEVDFIL